MDLISERLARLDMKYRRGQSAETKRLRVFYGWAKVNRVRKKEAISVIYENDSQNEERTMRFISRMQDTVFIRDQTGEEKKGASGAVRMYTEYSVFLDERRFQGSIFLALRYNSEADSRNVDEDVRDTILERLKEAYMKAHPGYREPAVQLEIEF